MVLAIQKEEIISANCQTTPVLYSQLYSVTVYFFNGELCHLMQYR